MSDEFGFVAMEAMTNQYLGGDSSLTVSPKKQAEIDDAVFKIVEKAHLEAVNILKDNMEALHEIARYLLKEETITGEQFMDILKKFDNIDVPSDATENN